MHISKLQVYYENAQNKMDTQHIDNVVIFGKTYFNSFQEEYINLELYI